MPLVFAASACIARAASPATTRSTTTQPSLRIVRTETPPTIDGHLDDAAWQHATTIENFTQSNPNEGAPPTERTVVRLLYDDNNIYIAFRCYDSEPDQICAKQMQRDAELDSDDAVLVLLDTFHDKRNGYFFVMGPAGSKFDALVEGGVTTHAEWDGIWYGKSSIDKEGWSAELAIPFKTLSFDEHSPLWGINLERIIRRRQEEDRWASPSINLSFRNLGTAGDMEGISGVHQGMGLTVKPFLASHFDLTDGGSDFKPGLDVFYKLSPSITAALTINTDFAETEVDDRQVNLTRFPLFFPEKRDFFLQDTGIFTFGGLDSSPIPFFSRRIGIVNGQQKDILAASRSPAARTVSASACSTCR